MFVLEFDLYLGDIGSRPVTVEGFVTDSFGSINARIQSVNLKLLGNRSLELRDLIDKGARFEIEEALLEHYKKIKEKHEGFPEDFPRDQEPA